MPARDVPGGFPGAGDVQPVLCGAQVPVGGDEGVGAAGVREGRARQVRHGPGRRRRVVLGRQNVDVVVRDSDPAVPVVRAADPGGVGQHGPDIVEKVTEKPSFEREPVCKRITARLALA